MAFLQICRRHQAVFEGVTCSLQHLETRKSFYSSLTLHRSVQNQPVCPGKTGIRIQNNCIYIFDAHVRQYEAY